MLCKLLPVKSALLCSLIGACKDKLFVRGIIRIQLKSKNFDPQKGKLSMPTPSFRGGGSGAHVRLED